MPFSSVEMLISIELSVLLKVGSIIDRIMYILGGGRTKLGTGVYIICRSKPEDSDEESQGSRHENGEGPPENAARRP